MPSPFPTSLLTPNPAAGSDLARQLAAQLPATPPDDASMAAHLRTAAGRWPDRELATAIYFHAIALANQGWKGAAG